jgi:hypothetical protein
MEPLLSVQSTIAAWAKRADDDAKRAADARARYLAVDARAKAATHSVNGARIAAATAAATAAAATASVIAINATGGDTTAATNIAVVADKAVAVAIKTLINNGINATIAGARLNLCDSASVAHATCATAFANIVTAIEAAVIASKAAQQANDAISAYNVGVSCLFSEIGNFGDEPPAKRVKHAIDQ